MKSEGFLKTKKSFRRLVIAVTAAVLALIALEFSVVYYQRYQASRLITALRQVDTGVASEGEVRAITKRYVRFASPTNSGDGEVFTLRNYLFVPIWQATAKFVYVSLEYKDGILQSKSVSYFDEFRVAAFLESTSRHREANGGWQVMVTDYGPHFHSLRLIDGCNVPLADRHPDWLVDLTCFSSLRPCPDLHAVIPRSRM